MRVIFITALGLAAAVLAHLIHERVLFRAPLTTDEQSYVFQAHTFLDGRIARPPPPFADAFFHEMIIQDERAGWLSRYPPGHPVWLLPGCLLDRPHLMVALAAALSVWLTAAAASRLDREAALPVAVILAASPFFLFTHGTLLSHTSGMTASACMLYGFIRWQVGATSRWTYAALAGLGWAGLWLNRSYTALWLAPLFGGYALLRLWTAKRSWRTELAAVATFAAVAALGVAALMGYNWLAVGHPLRMTYLYYEPADTPGFGPRFLSDMEIQFTPAVGLAQFWDNVRLLDAWLLGGRGSLLLCLALAFAGWRAGWTPLLLLSCAAVWLGYIAFFYPGPNETGPGYYFETLPMLVVAAGLGIARIGRAIPRPSLRRAAAIAAVAALVAVSGYFAARQIASLQALCRDLAALQAQFRALPPHSLVLCDPHVFTLRQHGLLVFNPRGLESDPLVMRNVDGLDHVVWRWQGQRRLYRFRPQNDRFVIVPLTPSDVYRVEIPAEALHYRTGRRAVRGADSNAASALVAQAERDAPDWLAFGGTACVYPGRFQVEFLADGGAPLATQVCIRVDVATDNGHRILAEQTCRGMLEGPIALVVTPTNNGVLEPRVYYEGGGTVTVHGIRLHALNAGAESTDRTMP